MTPAMVKVLVIGETRHGSSYLRGQLESRGCRCWFAESSAESIALYTLHSFHLILSTVPLHLRDPLLDRLSGSDCAVFCSFPVEDSCWWIPVVYRGRKCLGTPALRPSEFLGELGKIVKNIQRELRVAVPAAEPQAIRP
jgi:hypothetical protein